MSSQGTWADLPLEVVHKIFGYCDPQSLLFLSQTSHQFNFHVLSQYFTQQITGDLLQFPSKSFSKSYQNRLDKSPPMRILRTAFCLSKTIQHIEYCTPARGADCNNYFNDLRDLTMFIRRMPKLTSLRVEPKVFLQGKNINEQSHQDVWNGLLIAVMWKECKIFEVKSYDSASYERSSSPPPLPEGLHAPGLQREPRLFRCFSRSLAPKSTIIPSPLSPDRWITGRVQPSLQEVRITGVNFRNIPLMTQTILTQHAASITRLSLDRKAIWGDRELIQLKSVFDHLHFPALKSFTFLSISRIGSILIFLKFLSRHPALTDLDLDADFRKDQVWPPQKRSFWQQPLTPRFPDLQVLKMFPGALICLVPDYRRCPNLRSITLKGQEHCWGAVWIGEPQDIIQSFFNGLHATSSVTSPLSVEITVPLQDLGWISKFHAIEGDKISRCWPRVKDLRLTDIVGYKSRPCPPLSHVLVNWLSSFPSLESLEIDSPVYRLDSELREELAKLVVTRYRKLRSFGLTSSYSPYGNPDHDRHGREWEMWDVQGGRLRRQIVRRLV